MSIENKKLISLFDSIIPVVALVTLLYINVSIYGDSSLNGSNQFILIIGSSIAFFFGIKNKGYIKEGFDADLTIADMNKEVTIKNEMIASKCGWTPFHNYKVKGFPVGTIINGHLVMSDGKVILESKGKPLEF